jgi:hypothetical protein
MHPHPRRTGTGVLTLTPPDDATRGGGMSRRGADGALAVWVLVQLPLDAAPPCCEACGSGWNDGRAGCPGAGPKLVSAAGAGGKDVRVRQSRSSGSSAATLCTRAHRPSCGTPRELPEVFHVRLTYPRAPRLHKVSASATSRANKSHVQHPVKPHKNQHQQGSSSYV